MKIVETVTPSNHAQVHVALGAFDFGLVNAPMASAAH